jgi:SAM-dependent methyltransferase
MNIKYYDTSEKDWNRIYANGGWRGYGSGPGSLVKNNTNLIEYLKFIIQENKVKKIVDIGCGDCQWIFQCFDINNIQYTGIDFSQYILNKNQKHSNISYIYKNIASKDFCLLETFDLLICKDLLHHNLFYAETIAKNLREIKSDLKIIVTPEKTDNKIIKYFNDYNIVLTYNADERKIILCQ